MCARGGLTLERTTTTRREIRCSRCGNKIGEVLAGQFVSTHRGRKAYGATAIGCEGCGHVNHLPAQWTERKGEK
jgi:hypothetical protein